MPVTFSTILPTWLVLPIAGLTMVIVAGHIMALQHADMPDRRRRLRTGNGILMLFVISLLAYALGIARVSNQSPMAAPQESREFVMIWLAIIGFLGLVIFLAGIDALHTFTGNLKQRAALRAELRASTVGEQLARAGAPRANAASNGAAGAATGMAGGGAAGVSRVGGVGGSPRAQR